VNLFLRVMSRSEKGERYWNSKHTALSGTSAKSDMGGFAGSCKMFVEIYPHWKNKGMLRDSLTMLRMRASLTVWLRIFAMRLWNIRFVHKAIYFYDF